MVVMSRSGLQYARNIQDIKLAPASISRPLDAFVDETINSGDKPKNVDDDTAEDTSKTDDSTSNLRQRSNIKRPSRFDDQYIFISGIPLISRIRKHKRTL